MVFKLFTIYGHGGHLDQGHFFQIIVPLFQGGSTCDFALIGQAVLGEMFKNNSHIHVYSCGPGAENPLVSIFFLNINLLSLWSFAASFSH